MLQDFLGQRLRLPDLPGLVFRPADAHADDRVLLEHVERAALFAARPVRLISDTGDAARARLFFAFPLPLPAASLAPLPVRVLPLQLLFALAPLAFSLSPFVRVAVKLLPPVILDRPLRLRVRRGADDFDADRLVEGRQTVEALRHA